MGLLVRPIGNTVIFFPRKENIHPARLVTGRRWNSHEKKGLFLTSAVSSGSIQTSEGIKDSGKSWRWPGARKVKRSLTLHSNPCWTISVLVEDCLQTRKLNQVSGRPCSDREQETYTKTWLGHDHQGPEATVFLTFRWRKTQLLYHLAIRTSILRRLLTRQLLLTHLGAKKMYWGCQMADSHADKTKALLPGKW